MFELTVDEYASLRSQFGALKRGEHAKYLPFAFTEQGVAMLSSILTHIAVIRSEVAVFEGVVFFRVSVCVLRIFV